MQVSRAIVATNDNPLYYEFWPLVAKAWRNFGIEPTVAVIGEINLDHSQGTLFKLPEIPGIPSGFAAQVSRFIIPCFFPEEVSLIGDIDMIPLNRNYFTGNILGYEDDNIVIFSADAYPGVLRYPMCYIAAKGKYFREIIGLADTRLETITAFIQELYALGLGWDTDELFFARRLHQNKTLLASLVLLKRGGWKPFARNRIDRDKWQHTLFSFFTGRYIDAHCLRPWHEYPRQLKALTDFVDAGSNGRQYLANLLKKPFRKLEEAGLLLRQKLFGQNLFDAHRPQVPQTGIAGKKIISFSLYGYAERYIASLRTVIHSYQTVFAGWQCRVYVGSDAGNDLLETLRSMDCEAVIMKGTGIDARFMLWRYLPIQEKAISAVLFRDLDSVASLREKTMVDEWLASPAAYHIIRDHPSHGTRIMGGMWGTKSSALDIKKEAKRVVLKNRYGMDQQFLEKIIYPKIKNDVMIHDSFPRFPEEQVIVTPFGEDDSFVGEIVTDSSLMQAGKAFAEALKNKFIDLKNI